MFYATRGEECGENCNFLDTTICTFTRTVVHVKEVWKQGHFGQTVRVKGSLVTLAVEGRGQGTRYGGADIYRLSLCDAQPKLIGWRSCRSQLVDKHTHTVAAIDEQAHGSTLF